MSRTLFIFNENQLKNLVGNIISEQTQNKTKSITINFGSMWPMGKWKLTPQQEQKLRTELGKILSFMNKNRGSKINIQIEAGESQVTNKDTEVSPPQPLDSGELSARRGESMKDYLETYFKSLIGKTISEDEMPIIPEPVVTIGNTPYSGPNDLNDQRKMRQYNSEQFVRAIVSAEQTSACLYGLRFVASYQNDGSHTCDEAIFEFKMNGVSIGIANLNNGELDLWTTDKLEKAKNSAFNNFPRANMDNIAKINDMFKKTMRYTDNTIGGSRRQILKLTKEMADRIRQVNPNEIVITLVPLVSQNSYYKDFFTKGTHDSAPFIQIFDKNNKELYSGSPLVGLQKGATEEVVLLKTDGCGKVIQEK
jgi:hypothetical protein